MDGASLDIAVTLEVEGEGLEVVVEPKLAHSPKEIFGGDDLALLLLAPFVGLTCHEADVLR